MKTGGYSIKDLEVLSGIKAHTIRIWEKRYNLLQPQRTDTNIRTYSDKELRKLMNVSLLIKKGYKISKVSHLDNQQIKETVLSISENGKSAGDYLERMLACMLNFDNASFNNIINEVVERFGLEEAVSQIFFHLFEKIGIYWQVGSLFPAQEHYVSNLFRQKIISETDKLHLKHLKEKTILFFLHENEYHELGLLFYSYLSQKKGYKVIYLGQNVPFADLKKISAQIKVDFVFTSFINSISKSDLESYLFDLKRLFINQKIFITGQQLLISKPALPQNMLIVRAYKEFITFLR